MARVSGTIRVADNYLNGEISVSSIELSGSVIPGGGAPAYEGSYEVTPSSSTQILNIQGKVAVQDITVHPIPSNYGLITYDGTSITVS